MLLEQVVRFVSGREATAELLGEQQAWLPLNPFYVLMETVRGPLVEGGASGLVWLSAVCFTLLTCAASFAFFVRFRGRIAFWV